MALDDARALPEDWPKGNKILVLILGALLALNSILGSSLPSGATWHSQTRFMSTTSCSLCFPTLSISLAIFSALSCLDR
ncbi:hypothetical protein BDV23DRAFT_154769 [Aspergillus alliaceus]|uniref:Uncharacterized protein n=1 Tax=Petromyces alliaceus TaxID=209559 RepID=A0A5N7C9C8_PETAA|nr:hypothetical protein BDV23DRAFT_154769 [Aspergillus alliaceus]